MYNYKEFSISNLKRYQTISRGESAATRWLEANCEEDAIVSIRHNEDCAPEKFTKVLEEGFDYKVHYKFLGAAAGDTRKGKMTYIKEEDYEKFMEHFMCGITLERINAKNCSSGLRFTNYLMLNFTNSVPTEIDLDRTIVVRDLEKTITYTADLVDAVEGTIVKDQEVVKEDYDMVDGCGFFLPGTFDKRVATFRMPWFKGLLVEFDYRGVAPEVMTDCWGKEHNLKEEGITCVFTDSQFKLWKAYKNWEEYKDAFRAGDHEFGWSVEPIEGSERECNYQGLQTLDFTWDETEELVTPAIHDLLRYLSNPTVAMREACGDRIRYYGHEELINSKPYIDEVRGLLRSKVNKIRTGKLSTHSNFVFISPDPYGFFGTPRIRPGKCACVEFEEGELMDATRSPHMYAGGHCILEVERVDGLNVPDVLYVSSEDNTSLLLEADWDGDKCLCFHQDCVITRVAARTEAPAISYTCKSGDKHPVSYDFSEYGIYNELKKAHGPQCNVGLIANVATKICNNTDLTWEERNELLKFAAHKQQSVIDYAKTSWELKYAPGVDAKMREQERRKLPKFMMIVKETEDSKEYDGHKNETVKLTKKKLKEKQEKKYEAEWNPKTTMGKINIILDMALQNYANETGYADIEDVIANVYYRGAASLRAPQVCTNQEYEAIGKMSRGKFKLPANMKINMFNCWNHEWTPEQQELIDACEFTFEQLADASFNREKAPGFTMLVAKYEEQFVEALERGYFLEVAGDWNTERAGKKYGRELGHEAAKEHNKRESKTIRVITEVGNTTEYASVHEAAEATGTERKRINQYLNDGKFHKVKNLDGKAKFES